MAALVFTIGAFVHIQFDPRSDVVFDTIRFLLEEANRARALWDLGIQPSIDCLQTSLFLYLAHVGLEQYDAASFRMREAATLANIMRLSSASAYDGHDPLEQCKRRATFLILTALERCTPSLLWVS